MNSAASGWAETTVFVGGAICALRRQKRQAPREQKSGGGHKIPQAPQLEKALLVSVSQPFPAIPSQSPNPALQEARMHAPALQPGLPLVTEHALPHIAQLAGSLCKLEHVIIAPAPQIELGIGQSKAHTPATHI